jgi:hypothetical protein
MIYLQTKFEDFNNWVDKNKTDRLDKGIKISTISKNISNFISDKVNEIFETETKCDYELKEITQIHTKILFNSKNNNKYRIDLFQIEEFGEKINHIGFTLEDDIFDTIPSNETEQEEWDYKYELPTEIGEVYDVLSRIRFILLDLVKSNKISNSFCIGGTNIFKKNKIYEFLLLKVIGEEGFEKRETQVYKKTGWGLYFKV